MKKLILNLGAHELSKNELKEVQGGRPLWSGYCNCPNGTVVPATGISQASACKEACRFEQSN